MADIKEAIRRLIFQYVSEGADKVMQTQEAVAAATTRTDKASLSLEKSFSSLERRYVDTVRYQQEYQKVQEKVNAAVAQNPALQERANAVLAAASEHYDKLAVNANKGGMAVSFLSKVISTIIGPAGLIGVALTAAGAAVVYLTEKFQVIPAVLSVIAAAIAGLGFEKVAQSVDEYGNRMRAVTAATEAQAAALQKIKDAHPGISTSVAEQLQLLEAQLVVAQAIGEQEKIIAQEKLRIVQLVQQKLFIEDAILIAAKERVIAETNAAAAAERSVTTLNNVAAAVNQINVAYNVMGQQIDRMATGYDLMGRSIQAVSEAEEDRAATAKKTSDRLAAQQKREAEWRQEEIDETRRIAEATADSAAKTGQVADRTEDVADETREVGREIKRNTGYTMQWVQVIDDVLNRWAQISLKSELEGALDIKPMDPSKSAYTTSSAKAFYDPFLTEIRNKATKAAYGEANVTMEKFFDPEGSGMWWMVAKVNSDKYWEDITKETKTEIGKFIGGLDISSPAAIQQSFQSVLTRGFEDGLAPINRFIDAVSDPATQANLIEQAIAHVQATQRPSLAREEMISDLNSKLEQLANSTDSLNATMQNALSPFYSQDPRTTKLGFRAGVTGNPEWMTGATNANPLVAVLGAGATAPGMAGGGSFVVGGGYSANDNRMAVFPVASGEEVVVNRNAQGRGGQVINIDNRIVVTGTVDADTMTKMKVSRYQQAQRMRAGMARG